MTLEAAVDAITQVAFSGSRTQSWSIWNPMSDRMKEAFVVVIQEVKAHNTYRPSILRTLWFILNTLKLESSKDQDLFRDFEEWACDVLDMQDVTFSQHFIAFLEKVAEEDVNNFSQMADNSRTAASWLQVFKA